MKPLHRILTELIIEHMTGRTLTIANCKRYITRDILASRNIRYDTPVTATDWKLAIIAAQKTSTRTFGRTEVLPLPVLLSIKENYLIKYRAFGDRYHDIVQKLELEIASIKKALQEE